MDDPDREQEGDITRLLVAWRGGDHAAIDHLFPLVYAQLRAIARRQLGSRGPDQTLNATALVHEAYLKLVDQRQGTVVDRHHFFAVAAKAMRHILIDHARAKAAQKRGGEGVRVELHDDIAASESRAGELLAIGEALEKLEAVDPALTKVVELRFFAGLSVEETAEILDVSERTVKREWRKARAFLALQLQPGRE